MAEKNIMESPNALARIAAVLFLIVISIGITLELFVLPDILVPGDAAATVNNLIAAETLFRAAVVGLLVRQLFLALLALVTYQLFKPVNKIVAGLMIVFALLSTPINMLNELNYFAVLELATSPDYLINFAAGHQQALVMFFLNLREYGTYIPGIFSLWITLLGYLAFKSRFVPRILGIWMMIGGIAYVTQSLLFYVAPNFDVMIFGLFAFAGELLFYLWLLIKGVRET